MSAPWSFSKLDAFSCPLRWRLRYVDRMVEDASPILDFGSIAHEWFATFGSQSLATPPGDVEEFARELFAQFWAANSRRLDPSGWDDLRSFALPWAARTTFAPGTRFEERLAITSTGKPCAFDARNVYLRGVLDVLHVDGAEATVTDRKTNYAIPAADDARTYLQGAIYAVLVLAAYPHVKRVVVEFDWTRHAVVRRTIVGVDEAAHVLNVVAAEVERIEATDVFGPKAGSWCAVCGFRRECPLTKARGPVAAITTPEQAEAVAEELTAMSHRREALAEALRAWSKEAGPIRAGDLEWSYHVSRSTRFALGAVVTAAEASGIPVDDVVKPDTVAIKRWSKKDPKFGALAERGATDASYTRFESRKVGEVEAEEKEAAS